MKADLVFLLENAAWPALLVDASGTVLRANAAAVRTFGPVLEGEMPRLSAFWRPENPLPPEPFLAQWSRSPTSVVSLQFLVKGGAAAEFSVAVCAFNRGEEKFFLFQVLPASAGAAAVHPPVTESALAQKHKLDCALQLARTVSLDFNNALATILGHTSFLLDKAGPDHPWRRSLLEVEKSAERAAEISNELAAFSRQEGDARRAAPGNLNEVVNRCVEFFRSTPGNTIAWRLQLERRLFTVHFDEAKVQQAFIKILENAAEALAGRSGGQVTVSTRNLELTEAMQDRHARLEPGAYVCVEITDNGPGFAPDVLPRVFEPFFTTKGGTHRGLGLALVYGIVTNHGGGVAVSGESGAGASVRVYLPAEHRPVRETPDLPEKSRVAGAILVVDDEPLVRTMARTILADHGYMVLTASSAEEALTLLSRSDPPVDVLLTDLVMPGLSGRELMERVRQSWPRVKLLCMSGYVMPADKQPEAGYLQKPFTSAELVARVRQAFAAPSEG
jgi:two-component system cell cycle sensor histidine kinase/response regulator CckA